MKKILAFCLALTLALPLISCGGSVPADTAAQKETLAAPTETAETADTEPVIVASIPKISNPLTRDKLEAIPKATADMTEEQLRQICVDYMVLQQGVVWTPDADWTYEISFAAGADGNGNINLKRGQRYSGLPYTSAATDLESFLDFYDEETGVLSIGQFGTGAATFIGDGCITSCYWGWARVSSTVQIRGVRWVNAAAGYVPIGPYTYDFDEEMTVDTDKICQQNGQQTMYESYAKIKTASGLMTYVTSPGHVRMAMTDAHVVRNADGTINGKESYVTVVEQSSAQKDYKNEDGTVHAIGKVANTSTFEKLYNGGYLPFDIQELCGRAAVQEGEVHLKNGSATLEDLMNDTVSSNYAISKVTATFKTADGAVAYETSGYGNCYIQKIAHDMPMNKVLPSGGMRRNLKSGTAYDLTFTVRISNGEIKTLEFGSVTY